MVNFKLYRYKVCHYHYPVPIGFIILHSFKTKRTSNPFWILNPSGQNCLLMGLLEKFYWSWKGWGKINGRTGYHLVLPLLDRTQSGLGPRSPPTSRPLFCTESDAHRGLGGGLLCIVARNRCFAKLGRESCVTDILMDLDSGVPVVFRAVVSPGGFGFLWVASH